MSITFEKTAKQDAIYEVLELLMSSGGKGSPQLRNDITAQVIQDALDLKVVELDKNHKGEHKIYEITAIGKRFYFAIFSGNLFQYDRWKVDPVLARLYYDTGNQLQAAISMAKLMYALDKTDAYSMYDLYAELINGYQIDGHFLAKVWIEEGDLSWLEPEHGCETKSVSTITFRPYMEDAIEIIRKYAKKRGLKSWFRSPVASRSAIMGAAVLYLASVLSAEMKKSGEEDEY